MFYLCMVDHCANAKRLKSNFRALLSDKRGQLIWREYETPLASSKYPMTDNWNTFSNAKNSLAIEPSSQNGVCSCPNAKLSASFY